MGRTLQKSGSNSPHLNGSGKTIRPPPGKGKKIPRKGLYGGKSPNPYPPQRQDDEESEKKDDEEENRKSSNAETPSVPSSLSESSSDYDLSSSEEDAEEKGALL